MPCRMVVKDSCSKSLQRQKPIAMFQTAKFEISVNEQTDAAGRSDVSWWAFEGGGLVAAIISNRFNSNQKLPTLREVCPRNGGLHVSNSTGP